MLSLARLTTVLPLLLPLLVAGIPTGSKERQCSSIRYSTVKGFFAQDFLETNETTFDFIKSNFGLLDKPRLSSLDTRERELVRGVTFDQPGERTAPNWKAFGEAIEKLNANAAENTVYKVFYLARHGEGYHNVAKNLWECYWSEQDGNGTVIWADAKLTNTGIQEAGRTSNAWKTQIAAHVPLPQTYYSSPLTRALTTLQITWKNLTLSKTQVPTVKDKLRETMGIHTCDRRNTSTHILTAFPNFRTEPGFSEIDELFNPIYRETIDMRDVRLRSALDEIFNNDDSTYISITAHGGAIGSIMNVIDHRAFRLKTGTMIPVVIKAEFSDDEEPHGNLAPPTTAPKCTSDPLIGPVPSSL